MCEHEQFSAEVAVQRLGDGNGVIRNFIAEIQVKCAQCGEPFHFVGAPAGFSFKHPTSNVGATTLHAPVRAGVGPVPERMAFEVST